MIFGALLFREQGVSASVKYLTPALAEASTENLLRSLRIQVWLYFECASLHGIDLVIFFDESLMCFNLMVNCFPQIHIFGPQRSPKTISHPPGSRRAVAFTKGPCGFAWQRII